MKRQRLIGYLFVLPSVLGVTVFFLLPLLFSFGLAFTNWLGPAGRGLKFTGLANFQRLFSDEIFLKALGSNILYLLHVPMSVALGFLAASALNQKVYARNALRASFFLPYLISAIAIGFSWMLLFHPTQGPINHLLRSIGVAKPPNWLASTSSAMSAIIIISTWHSLGFNMIIFLAVLQDVPRELKEAAAIDGASSWQITRHVTLPFISPITFFLLVIGTMNAFKSFGLIQAVTGGGPANSTLTLPLYVYRTAFRYYELGYASTIAIILFLIIFAFTVVQWYGQKKWVHY
ncbi:MAG TPA: sugar ABC transporter permease [Firmicutes bacterium]|jgi:multiple sugar transport system permease protein|nr:sugar ABC transporter permease [Bacillota bacterium]